MHYRTLGKTGWKVSDVACGLWGMSGWSGSDDAESLASLQLAADLGCNFFDTAWGYGEGHSDQLLGKIIAANPGKRLYAASKIPPLNRKWPALFSYDYSEAFPPEHVFTFADKIRRALGVDTIDLLQFHVWNDSWTERPEFRSTVEKLKHDGIIHSFGLSLNRWEPANGIAAIRTGLVDTVQVIYNVLDQNPEDELFPACLEHNVGVIARVPLDEGSLGGKLTRDTVFPPNDFRSKYFSPENLNTTLDRVDRLAADLPSGMTLPEAAIRYILSHPAVSTLIAGMRKEQHVRQNLALSDAGGLDAALLSKLKAHRWERTFTGL
ncbi:aldo/keto reductase [Paracidobacterium acidisoli]|uniref:Aldo/keto reductase n=1 Tax=Paracidobacterium acidisoli TaxID=2303751 RepID=A0A372IUF8_9BACT|nr:aldo/keto reductase [Paracidobacterium acidisoli]MBT9329873.1 aldo/keto reductase [Paracidobacterium acidisoli]